jgi:hypothetical protein
MNCIPRDRDWITRVGEDRAFFLSHVFHLIAGCICVGESDSDDGDNTLGKSYFFNRRDFNETH